MNVAQHTSQKKHSKAIYRMHLLGICVRVMRSFLFNLVVFFAGASIGMGFTVMKFQKMWQDSYDVKAFSSLTKLLRAHNIHDKDVDNCLLQMKMHSTNSISGIKEK